MTSDVIMYAKELELSYGSSNIQSKGRALVIDQSTTFKEIQEAYFTLATMNDYSPWLLGDLSLQAEAVLGEEFHQIESEISEKTALDLETIKRYRQVAKMYAPKERMNISFDHHRVAQSLDKPERKKLLTRCIEEGIGRDELRQIVKAQRPSKTKDSHQYIVCQHNLRDSEVDMGTLYEKCSDPANRSFTSEELHSLGLANVNDTGTIYIIIRKPTIDVDDEPGREVDDSDGENVAHTEPESMEMLVDCAVDFLKESEKKVIGLSMLQKELKIGFLKAQELLQELEDKGIVGPADEENGLVREVLVEFEDRAF